MIRYLFTEIGFPTGGRIITGKRRLRTREETIKNNTNAQNKQNRRQTYKTRKKSIKRMLQKT
jgi:hypothetical protein